MDEELRPEDIRRKGFYDLCNLLNRHKGKIKMSDLVREVTEEGWYDDFKRIGYNSIIRQLNRHNKKFQDAYMHSYTTED